MSRTANVSVVMPVYNAQDFLEESIESILNQTYEDFEFIIIDDGSIDNSLEIIDSYASKDKRIIVMSRENKGLVYSLNEGISISKGKYIARMDADDISLPERFEAQIVYLEKNKDIHILGTAMEAFGNGDEGLKNHLNRWFSSEIDDRNMIERTLKSCPVCHPSTMIRKSTLISLGGYKDRYSAAEDYDLWCRAIKEGYKIRNLGQILIKYRLHENSKSSIERKKLITGKNVVNIKLDFLEEHIDLNDIKKYLIWGASNGGKITKDVLGSRLKNSELLGFVDLYKEGNLDGIRIFNDIDKLDKNSFDYIFIATTPGRDYAQQKLNGMGFKMIKNFIWTA